ncbi:MAG: hypothetical protein KBH45_06400 [Verrucomicrobia bacterium]|nr:hypothetical protein [Verrucomicrobiota bacterium]
MNVSLVRLLSIAITLLTAARLIAAGGVTGKPAVTVESNALRLTVGTNAHILEFTDKSSGINYAAQNPTTAFARVKKGGKFFAATAAKLTDGRLVLEFADTGVTAALRVVGAKHSVTVEVLAVTGEGVEEFVFADVPLKLKGAEAEPFAGCALALNLQTNVRELPRASSQLEASCYPRFGFAGAKVALIGCPKSDLRRVIQEVVTAAPDLPHSPIGGPWALDAEINQGSYLFNFGDMSEDKADDWIKLARSLGLNQIDFHGGSSFRFGDCEPNPKTYPNGRASLKAVVDKLHAAGLKAGLHTYAFFIDKKCPWVTPVPDQRLAKDATFTLAEALDGSTNLASVFVTETTTNLSATTGFFVRNSATLHVDDELIVFSGASQTAPYAFTNCQRGAWGTRVAPHAKGAKVHHLKECFGLFVPDGDTDMLADVAAATARTFNECGFDMMYLDALDGEDILGGWQNAWHYGSKFVFEIWKRLDRPALMEMSTFHHHLWYVRSRMGAWDHPTRDHKRFIDIHNEANADGDRMFLPMHLGWWAVKTWTGPQGEPTFADDMEYLCGKAIGNNVGFSLMGVDPANFAKNPALQRLGGITRQYEELRHSKYFSEAVKARLRVPGDEFTLDQSSTGKWQLRPAQYAKHKVEGLADQTATWTVTNTFAAQPLRLRLEVLMSAEPYETTNAITVAEFKDANEFPERTQANGVAATLAPSTSFIKFGGGSGLITATNARPERAATWASFGKTFSPPLNLGGERALGVWVYGDGQGEVLNLQLRCPAHVVAGTSEHYVVVNFTGWRYFELIEPAGHLHANYSWPYGGAYDIYRETVDYKQIEKLSVWINNLPANGAVKCYLSPVRATPLVKAKIQNPRLIVGDRALLLPVTMQSGSYLEFNSPEDCKVFGPDGSFLQEVKIAGAAPILAAGVNQLRFECDPIPDLNPRVRLNVATFGTPLAP